MELPHLGIHCFEKSCNRLDFLPMKCDVCSNQFCLDHFPYNQHSCTNAYQKDAQVPVCPLCNNPVPSKRGEAPDIAVGEHIDRDCKADPAISKRKVYTNKCSVKGCKLKEVVRINCNTCDKKYCLKHRHPDEHNCSEQKSSPSQLAGAAAMARVQNTKSSRFPWFSSQSSSKNEGGQEAVPKVSISSVQAANMSEDEALALALQKSLNEATARTQEQEDLLLAQALADCDQEIPPRVSLLMKAN